MKCLMFKKNNICSFMQNEIFFIQHTKQYIKLCIFLCDGECVLSETMKNNINIDQLKKEEENIILQNDFYLNQ